MGELSQFLEHRDGLRDRIKQLEERPLEFSRRRLAQHVEANMDMLTPDQKKKMSNLIEGIN